MWTFALICREAPAWVNNTVTALPNALHHPEVAIKLSSALKDDILMAMDRNPISLLVLLNISAAFKHSQAQFVTALHMWHCLNRDSELQLCQSIFYPGKTHTAPTESNSLLLLRALCTLCCSPSPGDLRRGGRMCQLQAGADMECRMPCPAAEIAFNAQRDHLMLREIIQCSQVSFSAQSEQWVWAQCILLGNTSKGWPAKICLFVLSLAA